MKIQTDFCCRQCVSFWQDRDEHFYRVRICSHGGTAYGCSYDTVHIRPVYVCCRTFPGVRRVPHRGDLFQDSETARTRLCVRARLIGTIFMYRPQLHLCFIFTTRSFHVGSLFSIFGLHSHMTQFPWSWQALIILDNINSHIRSWLDILTIQQNLQTSKSCQQLLVCWSPSVTETKATAGPVLVDSSDSARLVYETGLKVGLGTPSTHIIWFACIFTTQTCFFPPWRRLSVSCCCWCAPYAQILVAHRPFL